MPSSKRNSRGPAHVPSSFNYATSQGSREAFNRPGQQGKGRYRPPAHGIDVAQCIGRCNASKIVGVVDNGGKKVNRLNQSAPVAKVYHRCVVRMLVPHPKQGPKIVGANAACAQNTLQGLRAQFAAAA